MLSLIKAYWRYAGLSLLLLWIVLYQTGPAWDHFMGRWATYRHALDRAFTVLLHVITPLLCAALGFGITFLRPRDPQAWLLLTLLLGFSEGGRNNVNFAARTDWLRLPAVWYNDFSRNIWPLAMFLFMVHFPHRLALDRRHPWLKWLWILPVTFLAVLAPLSKLGHSTARSLSAALGSTAPIIFYALIGSLFVLLGYRYHTTTTADDRRRLRLLYWGSAVSLSPALLWSLVRLLLDKHHPDIVLPPALTIVVVLLVTLFPLTLAYVIVVERAMDVRVVVRQGIQYALARNGVLFIQIIATVLIILASVGFTGGGVQNGPQRVLGVTLSITLVFLLQRVTNRLRLWLDRRFFREVYRAEQVLGGLSEDVRTILGTAPLLETVARRISDALHVPHVAMLLRDNASALFRPAYALGYEAPLEVTLTDDSPWIVALRETKRPLPVNSAQAGSLKTLAPEVFLPLAVRDHLLGVISLGIKQSEEPYSPSDLQLLASVAAQTGLALENSRLAELIAVEAAQRERLNRELEIAREVQQRLFPQTCPPVEHLEYAGTCRPALVVGGDYYDFIALPGGRWGLAVGDVSGKGIPAALLMASLQASLRGQALTATGDLATLMSNLNRLVFDASPANRYATLFYAQYDPGGRTLTYVNGGHNPPLLFRGSELFRLEEGGPLVGLFPSATYTQACVRLQPGDLLVAFTDGISEAMNQADQEWGEDRLTEAIGQCHDMLKPKSLLDHVMRSADEFTLGAPQHDDMTLVMVRVVGLNER